RHWAAEFFCRGRNQGCQPKLATGQDPADWKLAMRLSSHTVRGRRGRHISGQGKSNHVRVARAVGALVGALYVVALAAISMNALPRTALSVFTDSPGLTRVCDLTATPALALSGVPLQPAVNLPAWCTLQHAEQLTYRERFAHVSPDDER